MSVNHLAELLYAVGGFPSDRFSGVCMEYAHALCRGKAADGDADCDCPCHWGPA